MTFLKRLLIVVRAVKFSTYNGKKNNTNIQTVLTIAQNNFTSYTQDLVY